MNTAERRSNELAVDRFYIGYLRDSLTEIERALKHLEDSSAPDASVVRAEVIAHKIKGNAALYDLPELGETAKELEAVLKFGAERSELQESLSEFADAIAEILGPDELAAPRDEKVEKTSAIIAPIKAFSPCNEGLISNKGVLLVFENPWFVSSLSEYLGSGVSLETARSCAEAVRWLSKSSPDLIVCESDLPDTPGIEFMQFFRGARGNTHMPFLLAFPGNASFDEISEAIAAGAAAFVENKNDVQRLAEQMRELLVSECRTVLIIDDDEPVREMLRHAFEGVGYQVDTAIDGIEALLRIRTRKPDLIILDRLMPRMNGEATLRELQASMETGSVPVIMLTAMGNAGEASKWLMRGASEFIAKPFDPEEVLARARKLLQVRKDKN